MNFRVNLIASFFSIFFAQIGWAQLDDNPKSDFVSLCNVTLKDKVPCQRLHQKFFAKTNSNASVSFVPTDLGAASTPIDSKIQFMMLNDPNYSTGIAYCYFVFRGWISSGSMSPDTFGTSVPGFAILNEEVEKYQSWLSTNVNGKKCQALVLKDSGVPIVNLKDSLKGYVALIVLNPYASIQLPDATYDSVVKDMALTINHERVHAFQVLCPKFESWGIKEWQKLSTSAKNEYIKKYPAYNWMIPKIAGREYVAYLYENSPLKVLELVKDCKIK